MRYTIIAGMSAFLFFAYTPAASAADEPCKITFCLWGKMTGSVRTGCSDAEKSFFNIVKKKHGSFLPQHTLDARKALLSDECPRSYDPLNYMGKVLSKFGKMKNA